MPLHAVLRRVLTEFRTPNSQAPLPVPLALRSAAAAVSDRLSPCPAAGEAGVLGDSSFLPPDVSATPDAAEPFQPIQAMESDESL